MTELPSESQWSAGTIVGDRYRLSQLIGAGAMAEVWRAEHITLETQVAVKLVNVEQDVRPDETQERFLREGKAAAKLRSPHVVQILDHGLHGRSAYIAMELLEGETLRHRLLRQGTLPPLEVARIISELARGLEVAHCTGIVHRDLKPENIFLAEDQGREVVKILDFGIAKRLDLQGVDRLATQEGFMVGTPCYMSPEQVMGAGKIDVRSDLWQIAVVMFECVCGFRPFDSEAIGELMMRICSGPVPVPSQVATVPPGFDAWFAQGTMRDPAARFQSSTEMAESLVAMLAPDTTAAALADSLPAWAPPALGSASGRFERSQTGPFEQSQNRLGTSARQTWSTAQEGAAGSRGRRLLLTAVLIGLPVTALAVAGLLLLLSGPDTDTTGPAVASSTIESSDVTTTASATTTAAPTHSPSASAATSSAMPDKADADADAGSGRPPPNPRPPGTVPAAPGQSEPRPPRHQRPEDVLGI